jgi:hypothetical protein
MSEADDLALIETSITTRKFAYLRMNGRGGEPDPPREGEHVNIMGFPGGHFRPGGGFVAKTSDPIHGDHGFTIGMNTEAGGSGGPVFDDDALLVGKGYLI